MVGPNEKLQARAGVEDPVCQQLRWLPNGKSYMSYSQNRKVNGE